MITDTAKLRNLIAENKKDRALELLRAETQAYPDLQNEILALSARFNEIRKKENIGLLSDREAIQLHAGLNFSILELINEMEKADTGTPTPETTTTGKEEKVFISYNHKDSEIAHRLKDKLVAENINVVIDSERMMPGEDIKEFIENCVRETGVTISLVSKNSLLSAWVAMESINTFYHSKTDQQKKFIGCFISDEFFKREFTDEALDHVEAEIKEIQNLVSARMEKNRSIRDLQNELTRLTELRHNMDEIIRRLRESLCIDIRNDNLDNNFKKIVQAIHS
jgi:hypothetical protein